VIRERLVLPNDLQAVKEKVEESDRLKSAFLANMSHEIRTPMNGILGFTDLLLKPDLNDGKKEKYIEIIKKSGDRMLNTVNDIIEISKIEAGLIEVRNSNINVSSVVKNLIEFFQIQAQQKGLTLSFESDELELIVNTDLKKFESILTNLIKNAIKFTNNGRIDISFGVKNGFLQFCVEDTGIGVPQNRIHAIFNRFEQADIEDTQVFQGSGLGLAIAKSYVEILGGKISVTSVEGEGSTFCFTLPYLSDMNTSDSIDTDTSIENNEVQFSQPKILIVEDDEVSADFLNIILNKVAATTMIVNSGEKAIEFCKIHPDIDLVLMDIKMPGIDGYEATRRIREFNKEVLIIAQTAYALAGDKEKAITAGCNDYIAKPVKPDELIEMITKQLNLKKG
jgi:CheY-like chemotaxis protein